MELKIIIPSLLVIFGWFIANYLTSRRDFSNKRREVRINYLINAYRAIASAANREPLTSNEQRLAIEAAIEDIQLLGSRTQVEALNNMISSGKNDFTNLLEVLRLELREELNIEKVDDNLKFYRIIN